MGLTKTVSTGCCLTKDKASFFSKALNTVKKMQLLRWRCWLYLRRNRLRQKVLPFTPARITNALPKRSSNSRLVRQSGRTRRLSLPMRAGSAITSISVFFCPFTVQEITIRSRPPGATTIPTDPLTGMPQLR